MEMKVKRVRISFKKRNVEDGVETRKIEEQVKLVDKGGDFSSDEEGTKIAVIELIGGASSFDISATKLAKKGVCLVEEFSVLLSINSATDK